MSFKTCIYIFNNINVHRFNSSLFVFFLFTEKTCTKSSLHLTPNVNVRNDKQRYNFNDEVTMSCNTGFIGKTVTARCTDVNAWSKNTQTCTSKFFHSILFKQLRVVRRLTRHSNKLLK